MSPFEERQLPGHVSDPAQYMAKFKVSLEVAVGMAAQASSERLFVSDTYQVTMSAPHQTRAAGWPPMIHLSVIRRDGGHVSWDDLQTIKNMLIGPEAEAIEIFPAESRLVNMGENRHLWVFAEEFTIPIGWTQRMVKHELEQA